MQRVDHTSLFCWRCFATNPADQGLVLSNWDSYETFLCKLVRLPYSQWNSFTVTHRQRKPTMTPHGNDTFAFAPAHLCIRVRFRFDICRGRFSFLLEHRWQITSYAASSSVSEATQGGGRNIHQSRVGVRTTTRVAYVNPLYPNQQGSQMTVSNLLFQPSMGMPGHMVVAVNRMSSTDASQRHATRWQLYVMATW